MSAFKLYLLRHAEAVEHAASDAERALTAKGEAQAQTAGRFCARHDQAPALILASPLVRAEQTARLAAQELPGVAVEVAPFLASGMQPETALEALREYRARERVMIVGHEPDFSTLVAHWLGARGAIHVRKASLTLLSVGAWREGGAILEWSVPSRLM